MKKKTKELNILHKPIVFLVNPNHRVKSYASPLFALSRTPKATSECTTTDAEHLKRNMGYPISQNRTRTFEQLMNASKAVLLEHHFDDHRLCGAWCPAMYWKDDEKV
jgi:hypothetical protein